MGVLFWVAISREGAEKCELSTLETEFSADKMYKATLLRRNCNLGEPVTYFVRLDYIGSESGSGWSIPGFELENDEYSYVNPELHWINQRKLEVLVHTRTLGGHLTRNIGADLIFVRSYAPKEPQSFPNDGVRPLYPKPAL